MIAGVYVVNWLNHSLKLVVGVYVVNLLSHSFRMVVWGRALWLIS